MCRVCPLIENSQSGEGGTHGIFMTPLLSDDALRAVCVMFLLSSIQKRSYSIHSIKESVGPRQVTEICSRLSFIRP